MRLANVRFLKDDSNWDYANLTIRGRYVSVFRGTNQRNNEWFDTYSVHVTKSPYKPDVRPWMFPEQTPGLQWKQLDEITAQAVLYHLGSLP